MFNFIFAECGEPMLTAEQAAVFFGIKQRRIFQIIETEAGAAMICLPSLAAISDGGAEKIKSDLKPVQPLKSSE